MIGGTEIHGTQILGLTTPALLALFEWILAATDPRCDQLLGHERKRELRIGRHALDDFRHGSRIEAGAHDALERVAVGAVSDGSFLWLGSGEAREPLGIRELRREIRGLAQSQIGDGGFASDLSSGWAFEIVSYGADAQCVPTR